MCPSSNTKDGVERAFVVRLWINKGKEVVIGQCSGER